MSEPKDNSSFFRKVVKFVANPATDWATLDTKTQDERDTISGIANDNFRVSEVNYLTSSGRNGTT